MIDHNAPVHPSDHAAVSCVLLLAIHEPAGILCTSVLSPVKRGGPVLRLNGNILLVAAACFPA